MKELTKSEIRRVLKGARAIEKDAEKAVNTGLAHECTIYACEAIDFGYLAERMREFYKPTHPNTSYGEIDKDRWGELPYGLQEMTHESQLQRALMLELFAHLKGVI